ncbi:MAG: ATPase family protein [Candidatus Dependentiae bacterium]|nr:ATPase family protein [Candidatus Dependentiae bacterium]
MVLPNNRHSLWRYVLIGAALTLSTTTHAAGPVAGADDTVMRDMMRALGDAVEATARGIGKGIEWAGTQLSKGGAEQKQAEQVIEAVIKRHNENITELENQLAAGQPNARLKPLASERGSRNMHIGLHPITAQQAKTNLNLSFSPDIASYFPDNTREPEFRFEPVEVDITNDDQTRELIEKMSREKLALENQLLTHKLRERGDISGMQVLEKVMVERQKGKTAEKTALINASINADQSAKNLKTMLSFVKDPKVALLLLGTFGAGVGLYHGIPRLFAGRPQIVSEMSFLTPLERLKGKKNPQSNIEQIVFTAETGPQIMRAVTHIKRVIRSGGELMNLIFFGPPGTGKTMSAKAIARSVGADYMLINASAFEQLTPGQAVSELEATFRLARNNKKPVVVFFDEADAVMGRRGTGMETQTSRRVINTFLANVSDTHDKKIMFILATNLPGTLDPAVLSRCPQDGWIFFGPPSQSERARILRMYLETFCAKDNIILEEAAVANMEDYANQLQGSTGRDLRAIARNIADRMVDEGGDKITDQLIRQSLVDIERNKKHMEAYQYGNAAPAPIAVH